MLANDSDPDGGALTVTQVSSAAHGTAAIVTGGQSVTYQSAAGLIGPDQFTYTVTDASGATATATVSVNVLDPTRTRRRWRVKTSCGSPSPAAPFAWTCSTTTTIRMATGSRSCRQPGRVPGRSKIKGRSLVYTIVDPHLGRDFIRYTMSATATAERAARKPRWVWEAPLQVVDLNLDLAILGPGNVYSLNGNELTTDSRSRRSTSLTPLFPRGTKIVVTFTMPDGSYTMGQLFASP